LTATERAILHIGRTRALAKLGRVQEAAAAVGTADEEFSHARPADEIYWCRYNTAQHAGETGRVLWDVAIHHDHFIAEARHRLSAAAEHRRH
jgi:hypothetical protein